MSLLNHIIFNSFLFLASITSENLEILVCFKTFFEEIKRFFVSSNLLFDKKSGNYWGLMDNKRNIFCFKHFCIWIAWYTNVTVAAFFHAYWKRSLKILHAQNLK